MMLRKLVRGDTSLEDIGLQAEMVRFCFRHNIRTINDLCSKSEGQMIEIYGVSPPQRFLDLLTHTKNVLKKFGRSFKK